MNCGYGEKLVLYLYGEAGEALKAEVEAHLPACASCRGELAALRAADSALERAAEAPSPRAVAAVMAAARSSVRRASPFGWGEALLSGALASALAFVFAFSGGGAPAELAWNSGLDSGLDSVEYSVYKAQADLSSESGDWDYDLGALEAETSGAAENA